MNRYKRIIISACTLVMGFFMLSNQFGPSFGATGSSFDGQTCSGCHSGGSYGTTGSIQLLQGGNPVNQYLPGGTYTVRVNIGGSSPNMGFQVTSAYQGSDNNINTWGTPPPGTTNANNGGRNYIQHTAPMTSAAFVDIPWTAPSSTDAIVFYAGVNRVNGNGQQTLDHASSAMLTITTACASITVGPGTLPNGTAGTAYNQTVTQSGATGTPSFTISSGSLPPGLSLNSGTGAITGTPTTNGAYTFTVLVTGGNGCVGSTQYTVTINCPTITLSPGTLPGGTVGAAYNQAVTKTGGTGTYTWSYTGTLPPGITFNTTTGTFSGTPTTTGTYSNIVVTATGNGTCTGTQTYSITIGCPTITVSPATIPTMTVGSAITPQTYTQSGGTGTITWSATGLPAGVTINSTTGQLSGTPTQTGTFNIIITASGNGPCTGTQTFNNVIVSCPTVTVNPVNLNTITVGSTFSQTLSQTGATGTLSWAVTAGTIPPGLSLNTTTGAITGTPTTAGAYCFTVTVTGQGPCTGSRQYCGNVVCPAASVSPGTIATIIVGSTYTQNFTQTGLGGTITWSTSGSVPTGLSINSTSGQLSGTPSATGSYTFTVTATSSNGCTASQSYTVNVSCATFVITPATLPNVAAGATYNQTIGQTGNFGTFTYTVTTGNLPTGLSLNSTTGAITGTATAAGSYTFTVTVANQYGCSGTMQYTIVVTCPNATLDPATLPNLPIGQAYNQTMTVTGGTGTFTYAVTTGSLPTGLTLTSGGVLSGTPTVAGTYTFTITATNQWGCTASNSYTIVVACPTISLSPGTLPPGNVGFAYNQTITVTGSTNTFTFSSTGTLPPGLTLNTTTGALTGTPTTPNTYTFTIIATDSYGCTTSTQYTVIISPCTPLVLSPGTLPDGTVNTNYNQTITQTGGTGTITWSSSGTLPPGVTLNTTTGDLSGSPTATGTYTFTIVATDQTGCSGTVQYTIDVNCPTITLTPATLPADSAGEAYSQAVTQSGSTGSTFTYTVSSGTLPPGISLDANTGTLTGISNATGTYTFDITVTDEYGCSGTMTYTIDVVCPVIVIDQTTLPMIYTNTPYNETLTQTGGTSPFTYTVTSGTLPGGLTLSTGGLLSGTTIAYGSHTITVTVTDSNGCSGTQVFTLVVDWPVSIGLMDFNAAMSGKSSAAVSWNTSNIAGDEIYDVEHSTDASKFNTIAHVKSIKGQSDYVVSHNNLTPGNNYYRLRTTRVNGAIMYSNIVNLVYLGNTESIELLPNIVNNQTTAKIESDISRKAQIRIIDVSGKVVYENNVQLKAGENKINLDLHELIPGNYTFHLRPMNVKPVKFTKQ